MRTYRTLWNVPYQRNEFFTGREDVLHHLHHVLHAENRVALSHPQGISGLGGIGKTQAALEYAYRYRTEYGAVLWVRADSAAGLASSFADLAHVLELPERHEMDLSIIVDAVQRWLLRHSGWLLIFDNMDDLFVAEPFLPKAGQGHIMFTTRAHALGGIAECVEVQQMTPDIGALFLLRRSSLLSAQAQLELAPREDRHLANQISQELDGLPLALDQAGAYIKERPCTLADYLTLYQTRRRDLLQARGNLGKDYPASVATTWSLSFEKVSQANPAAAELLDFCAFFAPDAIPEEMLAEGAPYLDPSLQSVVADPVLFDQALVTLRAYSLLDRNTNTETVSIHRLVQAVLQDALFPEKRKQWMERAVLTVNSAFPAGEFATWAANERLMPQALVSISWIKQEQMAFPEAVRLLGRTGVYLEERARYAEAEQLYLQALTTSEQQAGAEHPETATILNNLAILYEKLERYEQAESLYQRALSIREQHLGSEHPHTAMVLTNLSELFRKQGKYERAKPFYERALAICEQNLGPEHPDTAKYLNNLANLFLDQGLYEQAEPLYQRALAIKEQLFGPEHPDTVMNLNNLAEAYRLQEKYERAEALHQRTLAIKEKFFGPEHPSTASSLTNLAILYRQLGKYEQAEPLYRRALAIKEQLFGPEHPNTASSLNNLAELSADQGKYEQAEPLYQRALTIFYQHRGAEHPITAHPLHGLASLYTSQGKYQLAEAYYQRALSIREQYLGPNHPETQETRKGYIFILQAMGRDEEANNLETAD